MRLKKYNFQIVYENHDCYSLKVRKPFLKYFYRWIPVTFCEAENTEDELLTFPTFDEAVKFIDTIAE